MFNGEPFGVLPIEIQNYILKIGLKHPVAKIFEDVEIPEIIFEREPMSFYQHFLIFNICNG